MHTLPAGKYYICDPCYVVKDSEWNDFCDKLFDGDGDVKLKNGRHVIAFSTAYGDGCYQDQYGNEFPVDAGLIGIIPVGAVPKPKKNRFFQIKTFEFSSDFFCESNNGDMRFGNIHINTGDDKGEA